MTRAVFLLAGAVAIALAAGSCVDRIMVGPGNPGSVMVGLRPPPMPLKTRPTPFLRTPTVTPTPEEQPDAVPTPPSTPTPTPPPPESGGVSS